VTCGRDPSHQGVDLKWRLGGYIRETPLNIEVEGRGEGRMKNIEKNEPHSIVERDGG
jgi:hypothetical protein